ncbi:MAG: DUF2339 domain-containing protein, partial [Oceanospirillum sp.]|nr:DUF2339 domain-containing protein [Oceanospirillum sp.]
MDEDFLIALLFIVPIGLLIMAALGMAAFFRTNRQQDELKQLQNELQEYRSVLKHFDGVLKNQQLSQQELKQQLDQLSKGLPTQPSTENLVGASEDMPEDIPEESPQETVIPQSAQPDAIQPQPAENSANDAADPIESVPVDQPLAAKTEQSQPSQDDWNETREASQPNHQPEESRTGWLDRLKENAQQNWMIWLGGICVGLAGVFMVGYSIEHGILGPEARIILSLLAGLGLHGLAEYL